MVGWTANAVRFHLLIFSQVISHLILHSNASSWRSPVTRDQDASFQLGVISQLIIALQSRYLMNPLWKIKTHGPLQLAPTQTNSSRPVHLGGVGQLSKSRNDWQKKKPLFGVPVEDLCTSSPQKMMLSLCRFPLKMLSKLPSLMSRNRKLSSHGKIEEVRLGCGQIWSENTWWLQFRPPLSGPWMIRNLWSGFGMRLCVAITSYVVWAERVGTGNGWWLMSNRELATCMLATQLSRN